MLYKEIIPQPPVLFFFSSLLQKRDNRTFSEVLGHAHCNHHPSLGFSFLSVGYSLSFIFLLLLFLLLLLLLLFLLLFLLQPNHYLVLQKRRLSSVQSNEFWTAANTLVLKKKILFLLLLPGASRSLSIFAWASFPYCSTYYWLQFVYASLTRCTLKCLKFCANWLLWVFELV